jgi:hypothetical protein
VKDISQAISVTRAAVCEYPRARVRERYPILCPSATCKASANDWEMGLSVCATETPAAPVRAQKLLRTLRRQRAACEIAGAWPSWWMARSGSPGNPKHPASRRGIGARERAFVPAGSAEPSIPLAQGTDRTREDDGMNTGSVNARCRQGMELLLPATRTRSRCRPLGLFCQTCAGAYDRCLIGAFRRGRNEMPNLRCLRK